MYRKKLSCHKLRTTQLQKTICFYIYKNYNHISSKIQPTVFQVKITFHFTLIPCSDKII